LMDYVYVVVLNSCYLYNIILLIILYKNIF
jgi:hypothetical protein